MTQPLPKPMLITDRHSLERVCARAAAVARLALDTEADSLHSYHHKLCLVQLSFGDSHAIIDPLALGRDALRPLADLLGEPGQVTLMHGADYDLRVLDRDLGARVSGVRDTQIAAQLLGEPATGLAALLERELGVTLDKRFQRADWGERPLSAELIAYAAADTAYLDDLTRRLESRLAALGRLEWWLEECTALETIRWEPSPPDPLAFERIKGAGALRGEARDRLAALHALRERLAAERDVPPFRVLRAELLLALAIDPPADLQALTDVKGMPRPLVRRFGSDLMAALSSPPPVPARVLRARPAIDREREARLKSLREARDKVAVELGIEPGVLAPRSPLECVVDRRPADAQALALCLGRRWRAAALAPHLLPVVEGWDGPGAGSQ